MEVTENVAPTEAVTYRAGVASAGKSADADPITTEIIRHGLLSAADEMRIALCRTAFSPTIYEVLDFACGLYDRQIRLLGQAPGLPIFLGSLSFCVEAVVRAVGGPEQLEPGDILLTTYGYDTGAHSQDAALVMPAFLDEQLVGYAVIKAHWPDIGAKAPYCSDTTDNFQEGTIYPGIRLYRRGTIEQDMYRTVIANSRFPEWLAGDLNAQVIGVHAGVNALTRLILRYGLETFENCVERIFDHGEATVRRLFEAIPDGRHVGQGIMDNNGISDETIPFKVAIEVDGSDILIDYSDAPPQQEGPINCPLPSTVAASRVAIAALAGVGASSNEGHFRSMNVRVRPGTLFNPTPPAPLFLYAWPMFQAIEVIYQAIGKAVPELVPACSAGDICGIVWWGWTLDGKPWSGQGPHPIGQGASARGDGSSALMHIGESGSRETPVEVLEAYNPVLVDKMQLAADSGGVGRFRGGLGVDLHLRMLSDCFMTATFERTKNPGWGLIGGRSGRRNQLLLEYADGHVEEFIKVTSHPIPANSVIQFHTGGGGGYGQPEERDVEAIQSDIRDGYVKDTQAAADYVQLREP
jgi:N-methylhydantoinase B